MNLPTINQENFCKAHGIFPKEYTRKAYWQAINDFFNANEVDKTEPDEIEYEYAIPIEETF